ncbi:hypothetical protein [Sorangium sp. So ce861]|uniref:hypothetical protein n=1 Tax=Sorangium sp. So ce861 TaxID=3133323 RepID=UPI003F624EC9
MYREDTAHQADVLDRHIREHVAEEEAHVQQSRAFPPDCGHGKPLGCRQDGIATGSLMTQRAGFSSLLEERADPWSRLFIEHAGQRPELAGVNAEQHREFLVVLGDVIPDVVRPGLDRAKDAL